MHSDSNELLAVRKFPWRSAIINMGFETLASYIEDVVTGLTAYMCARTFEMSGLSGDNEALETHEHTGPFNVMVDSRDC
jgi:hypothetical protein